MPFYQRFSNIMEKNRKPFFVLFVLLMFLSVAGIFQLRVDPDLMIFMPNHSPSKTAFDEMNRVFENGDELIILLHTQKDSLDEQTCSTIVNLHDTLSALPGIAYVISPVANHQIIDRGFSGEVSSLKLHDGEWKVFMSLFADSSLSQQDIFQIESLLEDTEIPYDITGTAFLQKRLIDFVMQLLLYHPFISAFLLFIVFGLQMRSTKATLMSIIPAVVGAVWALGLAGWIGKEISIVTATAPIFTIVIGSANGLHFISHYLESIGCGKRKKEAVSATLQLVGVPMIITAVTSIAGFLSLLIMDTNAVRELAVFTSVGIAFAGIAAWFVLPLFLINVINFKSITRLPLVTGQRFKKLWGVPTYILTILIIVIALWGFPLVKTDFNQLSMFKPSTDVAQSAETIAEVQGGSLPVYVYIQHESDILDENLKSGITLFSDSLRQFGKVISPYETIDQIVDSPLLRMLRMFSSERTIISDLLEQNDLPLQYMINLEEEAARITILPLNINHTSLSGMQQIAKSVDIPGASVVVTGISYIMDDLNQDMIENLKNTLILSVIIMFVLLLIAFRKLIPALISLVPILITTLFLYGFLGLSGLSLTLFTATVFSITIGVGVDYAVHLTSVALKLKNVDLAFNYVARPVVTNALGLTIGVAALVTSPLAFHFHVSVMIWVTMMLSMFLSLSLLPTLLNSYFKRTIK